MARPPDILLELGPTFASYLPDPGQGWNPTVGAFSPEGWAAAMVKNGTAIAGQLARRVSLEVGWPEAQLPALVDIAQTAIAFAEGRISVEAALRTILQVADLLDVTLTGTLADVSAAIAGVIDRIGAAVPVAGWVLQFAMFVRTSVVLYQSRNMPQAPGRPLQFNATRDEIAANAILEVLRTRDWTPIWTPPVHAWGKIPISYDPWGKVSGWAFGPNTDLAALAGTNEPNAHGFLPGIVGGRRPTGAGRYFQGPVWETTPGKKCLVDNKDCPAASSTAAPDATTATLAPSATLAAGFAWAHMEGVNGSCANADYDAIEAGWQEWQAQGTRFLEQLPETNDPRDRALRAMVRAALGYHGNLYPRAGVVVALQVRDAIARAREQLWRLLGTIACAYVPAAAPGLRGGRLRSRHREMRRLLLAHPARYDVELDMVADDEYRSALADSRRTPEGIGLAAPGVKPTRQRKSPTLDRGPAPRRPRMPELGGGGGGAAIAAVGVAALAAAIVAWRSR